jgi:hypothetical protein
MKRKIYSLSKFTHIVLSIFVLLGSGGIAVSNPSSKVNAYASVPSWWNAVCDTQHYSGSAPLPSTGSGSLVNPWNGIYSCGPRPEDMNGNDVYQYEYMGAGADQWEWECVELVERYMREAFNITPYGAYGAQIVSAYNTNTEPSNLVPTHNDGNHGLPNVGDVISFGNWGAASGHAAIITDYNPATGYFTYFNQNSHTTSVNNDVHVVSGKLVSAWGIGGGVINGWLHYTGNNQSPGALSITSGINNTISGAVVLGQPYGANYTVQNTGGSAFPLSELY